MMPLLASSWEDAGEHPGLELWAPFEEALGKAPFFGGDAFSDVDLRVAPWVHSYMAFDATFGDESHPPLDWEADLPNICRWLDGGGMMRMIRRASVTERRYQLLLAYILPKEINPGARRESARRDFGGDRDDERAGDEDEDGHLHDVSDRRASVCREFGCQNWAGAVGVCLGRGFSVAVGEAQGRQGCAAPRVSKLARRTTLRVTDGPRCCRACSSSTRVTSHRRSDLRCTQSPPCTTRSTRTTATAATAGSRTTRAWNTSSSSTPTTRRPRRRRACCRCRSAHWAAAPSSCAATARCATGVSGITGRTPARRARTRSTWTMPPSA